MQQHPSVLAPLTLAPSTSVAAEGFDLFAPESSSPSRRQRISMACQYCRHRKIRCCGGAPCRNCQRSHRECEYAPVPEEVNRATREKKAFAKATKHSVFSTPNNSYSPYFVDTPVFDLPYVSAPIRPVQTGHRRSVSVPNFETAAWTQLPSAPQFSSPAVFESAQWMYATPEPTPAFPSVLEQTPLHTAYLQTQTQYDMTRGPITPPHSRSPSAEVEQPMPHTPLASSMPTPWSAAPTMQTQLRPPTQLATSVSPPVTPSSLAFYIPYTSPPFQAATQMYSSFPLNIVSTTDTSPTLAPELSMQKPVGLGIDMPDMGFYHTPLLVNDEYFATPRF